MSTDMAVSLAKKFIRQISQPFDHTQTGISLWTLDDIEDKQRKEKEEVDRAAQIVGGLVEANGAGLEQDLIENGSEDIDMEYDQGLDDEALERIAQSHEEGLEAVMNGSEVDAY